MGGGIVPKLSTGISSVVMEPLLIALAGVLGGAVAVGVVAAWLLRRKARDPDFDELLATVAQHARTIRSIQMRSVRAAAAALPPRIVPAPAPTGFESKAALRSRVFSRVPVHEGGGVALSGNPEGDPAGWEAENDPASGTSTPSRFDSRRGR